MIHRMPTHPKLPRTILIYTVVLFLFALMPLFTLKGVPSWKRKYVLTIVMWHVWFNLSDNRGGEVVLGREHKVWRMITDDLDLVDKDTVDFLNGVPVRAVIPGYIHRCS